MKRITIYQCTGDSVILDDCSFFYFKYERDCLLLSIKRSAVVGFINIYVCNCGNNRRCYTSFHDQTRYFDPGLYWMTPQIYVDAIHVKPNVRVFKGRCSKISSIKFHSNTLFVSTAQ